MLSPLKQKATLPSHHGKGSSLISSDNNTRISLSISSYFFPKVTSFFLMAAPAAQGSSQARSQIRGAAQQRQSHSNA